MSLHKEVELVLQEMENQTKILEAVALRANHIVNAQSNGKKMAWCKDKEAAQRLRNEDPATYDFVIKIMKVFFTP